MSYYGRYLTSIILVFAVICLKNVSGPRSAVPRSPVAVLQWDSLDFQVQSTSSLSFSELIASNFVAASRASSPGADDTSIGSVSNESNHATNTIRHTAFLVILVGIASTALLWHWRGRIDPGNRATDFESSVPYVCLFSVFLGMVHNTMIIPESYNLARAMHFGPTTSGWMIGLPYVFNSVAALFERSLMSPWNQEYNRMVCIRMMVGIVVSCVLGAVAADPPGSWGMPDKHCIILLLLAQAGRSFCYPNPLLKVMAMKTLPLDSLIDFNVLLNLALTMGIGAGPLLSTMVCWDLDPSASRSRSARVMCVMAGIWILNILALMFYLPDNLQLTAPAQQSSQDRGERQALDNHDDTVPAQQSSQDRGERQALDNHDDTTVAAATKTERQWIWIHAAFINLERAFIVSALEATTAMILEMKFTFDTSSIGCILCATFMAGLPFCLALHLVRHQYTAQLLLALPCVSGFGSVFLFKAVGATFFPLPLQVFAVLLADSIIFPTAYLLSGVVNGLVAEYALPGTLYSLENYVVVDAILQNTVGRCFGPPLARSLFQASGRDMYASVQLGIGVLSAAGAFSISRGLSKVQAKKQIFTTEQI